MLARLALTVLLRLMLLRLMLPVVGGPMLRLCMSRRRCGNGGLCGGERRGDESHH
jgi:hypothetical protein